jgi:hypothetical protein
VFKQVMQELYRIASPTGVIEIHVPHHKHDNYWSDPTHVRAMTPLTFQMLSKRQCDDWIKRGVGNTMLAHLMAVDFEILEMVQVFDPVWYKRSSRAGSFWASGLAFLSPSSCQASRQHLQALAGRSRSRCIRDDLLGFLVHGSNALGLYVVYRLLF